MGRLDRVRRTIKPNDAHFIFLKIFLLNLVIKRLKEKRIFFIYFFFN